MISKHIQKQITTTYQQVYGLKITYPRRKQTLYEKERIQYKQMLKTYRKQNIKEYWDRQAIIENEYIENFLLKESEQRKKDELNLRTQIINIAFATHNKIQLIQQKNEERRAKFQRWMHDQEIQKLNRQKILNVLNLESQYWFTPENIEYKMQDQVLIPDTTYTQTDYYIKLQEQALLFESADYVGLEDSIQEKKQIKFKNKLLIPLFQEIVSIIKHIQNTQEYKLKLDYSVAKAELESQNLDSSKVDEIYESLFNKLKQPKNQIETLSKDLVYFYNLLNLWEEYMKLAKMNFLEINELMEQEKKNGGLNIIEYEEEEEDEESQVEITQEGKYTKIEKKSIEQEQFSAHEKLTSESDEDIDFSMTNQPSEIEQELIKKLQNTKNIEKEIKESQISSKNNSYSEVDKIFQQIEEDQKKEKELDKKFDDLLSNQVSLEQTLYGFDYKGDVLNQKEYGKNVNIDAQFAQQLVNEIQNFSEAKLKFQTVDDILHFEQKQKLGADMTKQLNTSSITEIFKNKLDQLSKVDNLTRNEKNKINKLIKVLNYIGEIRVEEPKMLAKIWTTYDPNSEL